MVKYPDDGLIDGEDQDNGVKTETTKCFVGPAEEFGLQPVDTGVYQITFKRCAITRLFFRKKNWQKSKEDGLKRRGHS